MNMATILLMSAKIAILELVKMKVFRNTSYGVIIFVNDVTKKILSSDENYIVNAVMHPKIGNSSVSLGEVITTSIL